MNLTSILSSIIEYIMPDRCVLCTELTQSNNGVCIECFPKINFIATPYCNICGSPFEFYIPRRVICSKCIIKKPEYDLSRSIFMFNQYSQKLLHGFKYNDKTEYASLFARMLIARYSYVMGDIDIITPVPMHKLKRLIRQYNPPSLLAKTISKITQKKMIPDLLLKTRWTKPQTKLTQIQRSNNLSNSMILNQKYNIKNKFILLLDDMKTTEATSNYCSTILKKAGAKMVKLFTIGTT